MKKIYFALAIGASCVAFAQKGKIGVNNSDPKATLDIQVKAGNTDTNEGILIPRVNKARVKAISSTNRVEGTLVYVTDAVQDSDSATFTGTGKGFYYYDAATQKWVKMGSGAATAPAPEGSFTRNVRRFNAASETATTSDYALINEYSGTAKIILPTAPPNGRTICGFNTNTSQDLQWEAGTGDNIVGQNSTYGGYGQCVIYNSDNKTWYTISAN
ncbi:hypothetical protein [Bergeyella zoohelcum]|uniref:hypothetical protein n=1 Tax=Bergeyella zoohelcum TaxID=1015 RepID=UPI0037365210